ncbi:MAG: DUF2079 domain-containing protein, partial [Sterolibacterium sp.]|nr:DUF2079 domain-containing protein [Sterolibacterium sp.]
MLKLKSMARGQLAVLALTGAAFILYLLMGLLRHWSYLTLLSDLGVFDQAAWATLHGDFMHHTINFPGKVINWLGLHFNLIVLAFVPLYAIAPWPEWFVLAQAAAIALAAWPLYRLALLWFGSERVAFYWALIYLVNPFVLNAAAWDFHPVALAAPCIAWALLALEQRRRGRFLACCVMLLLIQEQLGLTVFGLGLLWGLRHHEWRFASAVALLGVAHAALVLGVLMPALSPTGQLLMASAGEGQLSRYSWLGGSATEI